MQAMALEEFQPNLPNETDETSTLGAP